MIDLEKYDFLDIGCNSGGTGGYVGRLGGTKGVGVSLDKLRLKKGAADGLAVEEQNPADKTAYKGKVRLSIISGCLEKLNSYSEIKDTLGAAIHVTRSLIVIRSPWFDSDGANLGVGLKTAWADKKTNRFAVSSLHLYKFLMPLVQKGDLARFAIFGNSRISHSSDDRILPLHVDGDNSKYSAAKHGPKPLMDLPAPTYAELIVVVARKSAGTIDASIKALGKDAVMLFDSNEGAQPVAAAPAKSAVAGSATSVPLLKSSLGRRLR